MRRRCILFESACRCERPMRALFTDFEPSSSHLQREVKWCATIMEVFAVKTSERVFRNTWRARLHSMCLLLAAADPLGWIAHNKHTKHNKCTRCLYELLIVVEHIYACNDTDPFCHSTRSRLDLFIMFLLRLFKNEMSI